MVKDVGAAHGPVGVGLAKAPDAVTDIETAEGISDGVVSTPHVND